MSRISLFALLLLSPVFAWADPPVPARLEKVADDNAWRLLVSRALRRPTKVETLDAGSGTYRVFVVSSDKPLSGQSCPSGTTPRNSVLVSRLVKGTEAGEVYPVRLVSECVAPDGIKDSLAVDADKDGLIMDAKVYNSALGVTTHPVREPVSAGEATSFGQVLVRLVNFLINN